MIEKTKNTGERDKLGKFDKIFFYMGLAAILLTPILGFVARAFCVILGFSIIPASKEKGLALIVGGIFVPISLVIPPFYLIQGKIRKK